MNYQPILSKVYFEPGLKQIAGASGFRAETLTALQKCSHFKHTHHFYMEAWEALYLHMVESFVSKSTDAAEFLQHLATTMRLFNPKRPEDTLKQYHKQIHRLIKQFDGHVASMSKTDSNWSFWGEFVQLNCFAYIALFCAIRSGNWHLRLAALKTMAPVFCAFDRPTYRKLIPQYLADCLLLPDDILKSFLQGGFSVSITGKAWNSVGIDEALEMLINKDCKMAVVHPTKEFVNRVSLYFPFRSRALHNIKKQLYPLASDQSESLASVPSVARKANENISSMKVLIESSGLLTLDTTTDKPLTNAFTGKTASPEQEHDLLKFRTIGQEDFDSFIKNFYIGQPSVQPTTTTHRLKVFNTTVKPTKRLVNQLQREKNTVTKCLRSRLLWAQTHGGGDDPLQEQYLELPRAIASECGVPNKAQKCNTTAFYATRYGDQVVMSHFPPGWIPDAVIIEGMFMINTAPLRIHSQMSMYTRFLFVRYSGWYVTTGVKEIHIIFDDPGRFPFHPKLIERTRRDSNSQTSEHEHLKFSDHMKVPSKWREILACRKCKHQLIQYIGESLLRVAPEYLRGEQKLFVAGAWDNEDRDKTWCTSCDGIEFPVP